MSTLDRVVETVVTRGAEETAAWGASFARRLRAGDVVALSGELGAGKTCLTKGIAAGLGVERAVTSPTFTLIHEYRGRVPVYHVDLYRLENAAEAVDIGVLDYLGGDGVCIVEWAEKVAGLLPVDAWRVNIEIVDEQTRQITVTRAEPG
jgi:tRNA threonylcarbamoyladenosine biosynthesis protein TsaE